MCFHKEIARAGEGASSRFDPDGCASDCPVVGSSASNYEAWGNRGRSGSFSSVSDTGCDKESS